MRNTSQTNFDILKFSAYKKIKSQYTDDFIRSSGAVKISDDGEKLEIAVREDGFDEISARLKDIHSGYEINFHKIKSTDFEEFIGKYVENQNAATLPHVIVSEQFAMEDVSSSSVINIINSLFIEALRYNSSDIHIEPGKDDIKIRYRIDGVLKTTRTLPLNIYSSVASRLKIMANINIMESRIPQDGHIEIKIENKTLDVRFSSVPIQYGESIVLRLFNNQYEIPKLDLLGFCKAHLTLLKYSLMFPNGIILLTGPTGSGKTTTLHAMLELMDKEHLKIITIEDPVERNISGVNQIQVNEAIGLTFESLLRNVLRQDPNVIMIGEIRDKETAELALRAALTGHLILATLHTNDSVSAIDRLKNMGLDSFLISNVLRMSVAQRLVRKVCPYCSKKITPPKEFSSICKKLGLKAPSHIKEEQSCEKCNGMGFIGRTAISEIFEVTKATQEKIAKSQSISLDKSKTLLYDAIQKVISGETTISEIKREGIYIK